MDRIQRMILRSMAWERAKGELRSMLQTHESNSNSYELLKTEINRFIKVVEDEGLTE